MRDRSRSKSREETMELEEELPSMLAMMLEPPSPRAPVVAELVGCDDRRALVRLADGRIARARSTVALPRDLGGYKAVQDFDGDDPIVIGLLEPETHQAPSVEVCAEGERLVLSAQQEIVLRCGEASITLTRAGKVIIRGAHVVSRSSGMNLLKGAAVEIN